MKANEETEAFKSESSIYCLYNFGKTAELIKTFVLKVMKSERFIKNPMK